jgi:hypothetical protein
VHLDAAVLARATAGGDLDVHGHADAELHGVAPLAPGGLLAAELVVADGLGRGTQGQQVAAAVVDVAGERREGEDVVAEQVLLAQRDGVDAELVGGLVDEALEQRGGLGPAGAAVRAHRRGVGDGHGDVELDGREGVRALRHPAGAAGQRGADAGIGAGVAHEVDAQPGERAVAPAAQLGVLDLAAPVRHGLHLLAAAGHPHHRSPEPLRRGGHHRVLVLRAGLAAEAATDPGRDDVDLVGSMPSARASRPSPGAGTGSPATP